jgi:hypothetical protein
MAAHLATECVDSRKCGFAIVTGAADDVAHIEHARSELHAGTAAPHIGPETDSLGIDLPETQRARARAHAVRVCERSIIRREVPWHDAVGRPSAPLEVPVTALPRVAEYETRVTHATAPTEVEATHGDVWRGQ